MKAERLFWEDVALLLKKQAHDEVHPVNWGRDRIEAFLVHLTDTIAIRCKDNSERLKTCKVPFIGGQFKPDQVSVGDYLRFWRIFKKKNSDGNSTIRNIYAVYLGYESYRDFCEQQKIFTPTLTTADKLAATVHKDEFRKEQDDCTVAIVSLIRKERSFYQGVYKILKILYPRITPSEIEGIDYLCLTDDGKEIDFAFRILDKEDNNANLGGCLKELKHLEYLQTPLFCYRLICNTEFSNSDQKELEHSCDQITKKQIASICDTFDIWNFASEIITLIDSEIRNKILSSNKYFKDEYTRVMNQRFYLAEVPYVLSDPARTYSNPRKFIVNKIVDSVPTHAEYKYFLSRAQGGREDRLPGECLFLISEFGFGKTSLLLNSFESLAKQQIVTIFIPFAQIPEKGFSSKVALLRVLLKIIYARNKVGPHNFLLKESSDLFDKISIHIVDYMLRKRDDIVLMIDGLDENYIAYSYSGLQKIFTQLQALSVPLMCTVRKEFWDDKQGNIDNIPSLKKAKHIILTDWTNKEIQNYLEEVIEKSQKLQSVEKERIRAFISTVKGNGYAVLYGDIPKRPLFLEMITRDIINSNFEKKNLAQVYFSYLHEKFRLDIKRAFTDNKYLFTLKLLDKYDLYQVSDKIFSALTEVAMRMLINDADGNALLLPDIIETELEREIKLIKLQEISITEVLLNSVIIPIDKRQKENETFRIKFAHRSFQEYFTAKFLFNLLDSRFGGSQQEYDWYSYAFDSSIVTFISGMINDIKLKDGQHYDVCIHTLKSLSRQYKDSNCLANVLTIQLEGISKPNSR